MAAAAVRAAPDFDFVRIRKVCGVLCKEAVHIRGSAIQMTRAYSSRAATDLHQDDGPSLCSGSKRVA